MGSPLSIRLFGGFEANSNGKPIASFESDKVRALLVYLLVESDKVHRRERLAGFLWPESSERRARSNLSQALYNLRAAIDDKNSDPGYLITSHGTIQFNQTSEYWFDIAEFTSRLDKIDNHHHESIETCDSCISHAQEAVSLYRGEFLAGFYVDGVQEFQEWCILARERFHLLAFASLQRLVDAYADKGNITKALEYANWLLDLDPYDENTLHRLMQILISNGQRAAALTQYENFHQALTDEFGLEPSAEITKLYENIRAQSAPIYSQGILNNLPISITSFVGRETEQKELKSLVENPDCRLLTILGPGGIGKTHLALEVAKTQTENFSQGVYVIPLNQVQSLDAIPSNIIKVLGFPVQEKGDLRGQLINYLRIKNILLVLDGFEYLVDGSELLVEILEKAPNSKVLVTSQIQLNVKGEYIYSLESMEYPDEKISTHEISKFDALKLFLAGAKRVRPDYVLVDQEIDSVTDICSQVQGMPLGILLASAWMATMGATDIAAEIKKNLDFLSGGWVDAPARHRNLRATLEYSWNLLTQRQKEILKSLSVFQGGFSRKTAELICNASPHELRALIGKSLLQIRGGRYLTHALLQRFANEKLNDSKQTMQNVYYQHSVYFCKALSLWNQKIKGKDQEIALNSIDQEHENARTAWIWAIQNQKYEELGSALDGLCRYYELRTRYQEGKSLCESGLQTLEAITNPPEETSLLEAQLSIWASQFCRLLERFDEAYQFLKNAGASLDRVKNLDSNTSFVRARLHFETGNLAVMNDPKLTDRNYRRCLEIFHELGEDWWAANVQLSIGQNASFTGNLPLANTMLTDSKKKFSEMGDIRCLARSMGGICLTNARMGKVELALQQIQETTALFQSIGDKANSATSKLGLASVFNWTGNYVEATNQIKECLPIYQELGDTYNMIFLNFLFAVNYLHLGQYKIAKEYTQKCTNLAREYNYPFWVSMSRITLGWIYVVHKDFYKAKPLFLEELSGLDITYNPHEVSLTLAYLGLIESQLEETIDNWKYICQALKIGIEINNLLTIYNVFLVISIIFIKRGELIRAIELTAPVYQHPAIFKSRCIQDIFGKKIKEIKNSLPPEDVAEAEERGLKKDLIKTATELLEEFCPE